MAGCIMLFRLACYHVIWHGQVSNRTGPKSVCIHRKRKRRPEREPEPERPDTVMRQKLRQHHTEHTEDEEAWQGADANGISRSASAEFEMDPGGPAGMLLDLDYHHVL